MNFAIVLTGDSGKRNHPSDYLTHVPVKRAAFP